MEMEIEMQSESIALLNGCKVCHKKAKVVTPNQIVISGIIIEVSELDKFLKMPKEAFYENYPVVHEDLYIY